MDVTAETADRKLPPAKGAVDLLSKSFRSVKKSEKEIRKNVGKTVQLFSKVLKSLKLGKSQQRKSRVQSIEDLLSEYANLGDKYAEVKSESLSKDEKIKALEIVVRNLKKSLQEKKIEELKRDLMVNR